MIDKDAMFSNEQAITVTAASDYGYDLGADSPMVPVTASKPSAMIVQIVEEFAGGRELYVTIQASDSSDFTDAVTLGTTESLGLSVLKAGRRFRAEHLPNCPYRYVRLYYVVTGTMSSGKISAGLLLDAQTLPGYLQLDTPLILVTDTGAKVVTDAGYEIQIG